MLNTQPVVDGWIIPARAGFTIRRGSLRPSGWDHPRSRGVYFHVRWCVMNVLGSSPLARGLPTLDLLRGPLRRIIPARAGFTLVRSQMHQSHPDHPRSRGVYDDGHRRGAAPVGSSPLARGLLLPADGQERPVRIIPARAGFTPEQGQQRPGRGDHPRSRGVYEEQAEKAKLSEGSSPLARGLRACAHGR